MFYEKKKTLNFYFFEKLNWYKKLHWKGVVHVDFIPPFLVSFLKVSLSKFIILFPLQDQMYQQKNYRTCGKCYAIWI